MATAAVDASLLLSGPGILYWAPLGTADPSSTVADSKLPATAWAGGWVALGSTDEGHSFSDTIATEDMTVEESHYPVKIVTTGREASWAVGLAEVNLSNIQVAMNGPTPTTTGTGATTLSTIAPPTVGNEVRARVGWQSEDDTVRLLAEKVLQVGPFDLQFRKGATKAVLACEFRFEKPTSGDPYKILLAGANRG